MAEGNATSVNTEAPSTEAPTDNRATIISVSVIVGLLVVALFVVCLVKKFFRSSRSKYADEERPQKRNRDEFFDQFQVNDHQATVNSITALRWEEDEKLSSGVECDPESLASTEEISKINTGKRVFTVNKVQEKQHPLSHSSRQVVVKVPKNLSHHVFNSLQASDGRQYTLALIDRQSMTIHDIDPREYRVRRSPMTSSSSHQSMPSEILISQTPKKKHTRSSRPKKRSVPVISESEGSQAGDMDAVDYPLLQCPPQGNDQVSNSSTTDMSDTSQGHQRSSASMSSLQSADDAVEMTTVT